MNIMALQTQRESFDVTYNLRTPFLACALSLFTICPCYVTFLTVQETFSTQYTVCLLYTSEQMFERLSTNTLIFSIALNCV